MRVAGCTKLRTRQSTTIFNGGSRAVEQDVMQLEQLALNAYDEDEYRKEQAEVERATKAREDLAVYLKDEFITRLAAMGFHDVEVRYETLEQTRHHLSGLAIGEAAGAAIVLYGSGGAGNVYSRDLLEARFPGSKATFTFKTLADLGRKLQPVE